MSTKLSLQHTVAINPEILNSQIDDETVLLNIEFGKYFGLDPIASVVWSKLKNATQVSGLIQNLVEEYNVSLTECEQDTLKLLQEMLDSQLIKIQHS